MSYPSRPILTMDFKTGEAISLDLSIDPSQCAVHRGPIPDDEEKLTMTLEHPLVEGPVTVGVCRSCLSEFAPKLVVALSE